MSTDQDLNYNSVVESSSERISRYGCSVLCQTFWVSRVLLPLSTRLLEHDGSEFCAIQLYVQFFLVV